MKYKKLFNNWTKKLTDACLLRSLTLLVLLTLSSCAKLPHKKKTASEVVGKICSNASGRARLSTVANKVVFNYAWSFRAKEKKLLLEVAPAFQDPEVLIVYFEDNNKLTFQGNAVDSIRKKLDKNPFLKSEIYHALEKLSWFILLSSQDKVERENIFKNCEKQEESCPFKWKYEFLNSAQEPQFIFNKGRRRLSVIFLREDTNYYDKLYIESVHPRLRGSVTLELFQQECLD